MSGGNVSYTCRHYLLISDLSSDKMSSGKSGSRNRQKEMSVGCSYCRSGESRLHGLLYRV